MFSDKELGPVSLLSVSRRVWFQLSTVELFCLVSIYAISVAGLQMIFFLQEFLC